jgi:hypothetical protein
MREYQQQLRDRFLGASVMPAPAPWLTLPTPHTYIPVGGLLGVGFAADPASGADILMVVSRDGRGLFDPSTGTKIARDRNPDPDLYIPMGMDLSCPGFGPLADTRVRIVLSVRTLRIPDLLFG